MLWQWSLRRHRKENKGKQWIRRRYFMNIGNKKWIFGERKENVLLFCRSFLAGVRYSPVKGNNSPYDPDLHDYWLRRHGKSWRKTTPMWSIPIETSEATWIVSGGLWEIRTKGTRRRDVGSWGASPVKGNFHAGFLEEGVIVISPLYSALFS